MVYFRSLATVLVATLASGMASASFVQRQDKLRVETHVNAGLSFNMVSSLIIGSKAAVLIDVPLAVPEAHELAAWVRSTTDKPLVAVARWQKTLGADNIVSNTSIPTAYDHTFFTLPGNEGEHIELVGLVSGDTVDETRFWIPSTRTLIAGDTVYSHELHIWLADLQTTALTSSWIAGLELIESMKPESIVAGHALSVQGSTAQRNLAYSQSYLKFWQKNIEAKGPDFYTPEQIVDKFNSTFPGLMGNLVSATLLNITAGQFGKGGTR
ncbi:Metallo-beta-lactamase family protein [Trichoderma simmonsii]|uniref:Metallo-beta-lactamase family protein n=1 Tax=Trichoderma simmonsii TaxID=1491479 RepID=A0A8G0LJB0_9HYPO|nr:Metallo-beta-lactamase family protein [Trichoderma simmonsii]